MFRKITSLSVIAAAIALPLLISQPVMAAGNSSQGSSGPSAHFGIFFAMMALVLLAGKIGNAVEKLGVPAVLGELCAGIILSGLGFLGWHFVADVTGSEVIAFAASFGALLLLFSIGLESNVSDLKRNGLSSFMVAIIGVVLPFVAGAYVLGPIFYGAEGTNAHLFLGASLVATSVGITASVFRTLSIQKTRAAQTVIGAAVIDDILGLIVLAIVSALAMGGEISTGLVGELLLKSFGFLVGALVLGTLLARPMSKFFSSIHTGVGMKVALAITFALLFGYFAEVFGLEAIIGAFAAGLLLDAVHFESFADPEVVDDLKGLEFKDKKDREKVLGVINKHKHAHVEDLIGNVGLIFIPIFFVYTGLQIDIESLLEPRLYVVAAVISIIAILSKLAAGFAAKGTLNEKLLVGMSMVPRGEVGLIFAATGQNLGVLSDELFSVIILVVIITTFIAPPMIKKFALSSGKLKAA